MDTMRRVRVLACAADQDVALIVKSVARAEKYEVIEPGSSDAPADLCIILMSRAAVESPEFLLAARAEATRATIAIPVRLDEVRPEQAGEPGSPLRERNWADFSRNAGRGDEQWRLLMRSNVNLYDAFYDLDERTKRWELCDHDTSYLLQDVRAASKARDVLSALKNDPYQHPTKSMWGYVAASEQHANKERKRLIGRRVRTACAALFIAFALFAVNQILQHYLFHARLLQDAMVGLDTEHNPEYAAFKLLQIGANENVNSDTTYFQTIDALSSTWKVSELGLVEEASGTGRQGRAVLTDDGERAFIAGPEGTIQTWLTRTAEAVDNRRVSSGGHLSFDVTPDGSHLVVADRDGVRRYDTLTWEAADSGYGGAPLGDIAVSSDGSRALGASDGTLALVNLEGGTTEAQLETDATLSIERTHDGLRALARVGSEVLLVDGATMAPLARAAVPEGSSSCVGAIGKEGAVIWLDGRFALLAPGATELSPIGFSTADAPLDLAVSGESLVVVTAEVGTKVVDMPTGAVLGTLGTHMAGVTQASAAEEGLVSCGNGVTTSIYSLEGIAPAREMPSNAVVSETLEHSVPDGTFSIRSDGAERFVLTYGEKDYSYTFQGTYGESDDITAVAAAYQPARFVIGTKSGGVTAYTLINRGDGVTMVSTREWDTPDGSPVEAVGWTEDGERLVVRAGGRWWTPYANSGAVGVQGIAEAVATRSPAVWSPAELESFPEDFVESMGMRAATPLPKPR